jgi:opacity protein-like surface antigen
MFKRILATAAVLALMATPAMASQCPKDMKAIDAALAAGKGTDMMDKVKALRAEGEDLHKAGKHKESVETLAEAKKLLGI